MIARLNMGGPAQQAALLSGRRLDPDRYETLLVHGALPSGERSAAHLAESEGARMRYLPSLRQPVSPAADAAAAASLVRAIRRFRPQIVHTHTAKAGFVGRSAALAAFGPRSSRRPALVHSFHGHVLEGYFGPVKSHLYRDFERILAKRTDRLIGVSKATIDDLVRLGVAPREKFLRLPLGLDLEPIAAAARGPEPRVQVRKELGLADDEVACIFVGRFAAIKRLDLLLEAFAIAQRSAPNLRLVIVGDGDSRPALEAQARRAAIAERISWLGYRADLGGLFAAADIAVISSDNEGTPVSLIEAGAAGIPAVSTDVGGVREVVPEGCGQLVPPGDAQALGAALACLAADEAKRETMGAAIREHVLSNYSVERLLANVDSLYGELAPSPR